MFEEGNFQINRKIIIVLFLMCVTFIVMVGCDQNSSEVEQVEVAVTNTNEDSSSDQVTETQVDQFPLTVVDQVGREVVFNEVPTRIVTVIPADMEIIYALGGEVVGRPQSISGVINPPEAEAAEDIGYPLGINYERIAALEADMFIGHTRLNINDVPTLEALDLNVVLSQGDSLADIVHLIEMYGNLLDKKEQADLLIAEIEAKITEVSMNQQENPAKVLILFGTPEETMAALPQSLAGDLFELAGAENISAGLPNLDTYPTYAQLSLERILEANPDAIYFMAHGDAELALNQFQSEMELVPAWNDLNAVKNGNLVVLPHDLFGTNPGPRIIDALAFLQDSLARLEY